MDLLANGGLQVNPSFDIKLTIIHVDGVLLTLSHRNYGVALEAGHIITPYQATEF